MGAGEGGMGAGGEEMGGLVLVSTKARLPVPEREETPSAVSAPEYTVECASAEACPSEPRASGLRDGRA